MQALAPGGFSASVCGMNDSVRRTPPDTKMPWLCEPQTRVHLAQADSPSQVPRQDTLSEFILQLPVSWTLPALACVKEPIIAQVTQTGST